MAKLVAPEKLGWLDHKKVLAWLWFLYCKPRVLIEKLQESNPWSQIRFAALVWIHICPYIMLSSFLGRLLVFEVFEVPPRDGFDTSILGHLEHAVIESVKGIAAGIFGGLIGANIPGIASGSNRRTAIGITIAISGGFFFGIATGSGEGTTEWIVTGISAGMVGGIAFGFIFSIIYRTARVFIFGILAGTTIGTIGGVGIGITFDNFQLGVAVGISFSITILFSYLRLYYGPIHFLFLWLDPKPSWYHHHPIAWDDMCVLPFKGLHRLLTVLYKQNPDYAEAEIERLVNTYPSQKNEALKARAIILAEKSQKISDLTQLDDLISQLPEGDKGFLAQTTTIKDKVATIARQRMLTNTATRAYMRKAHLETLASQIEALMHQVVGFNEPLASCFGKAAKSWLIRTKDELEQGQTMVMHQQVFQVFRAGDPVDRDQEAFVPRLHTIGQIERQLTMAQGCPGLLLYARRRMGKSSLLRNLNGFLPDKYRLARLSLQNPRSFADQEGFVRTLGDAVEDVWPDALVLPPQKDPLAGLFQQLEQWNKQLAPGERLLLALDEYEMIDRKIGEGVFKEDLLATLRESMQQHRNLTWMLSGSHDTNELENAPWESYLVSMRTVEIPFFSLEETHLLLTDPLSRSTFWGTREDRPRMDAEFWGKDGIEKIHHYSGGWPHLTQLMAETLVDMVNDFEKKRVDEKLFNKSLDESVLAGTKVLFQLMMGENTGEEEQGYLYGFMTMEHRDPPKKPQVVRSLKHRKLIIEENNKWRLRAPLMRHWLKKNG